MLTHNAYLKHNHFNTVHQITEFYPEYDLMTGERYTVVVMEDENGNTIGIAENIIKQKYTIMEDTKELKIKRLMDQFKKYNAKYKALETAAKKDIKEKGNHNYKNNFKQLEYWEDEILEAAERLGVNLYEMA